nr:MAG TPA: hypothetical protein [Caudoviricetes sp.]
MTETDNFKFKKPNRDDFVNIDDINENMDMIDAIVTEFQGSNSKRMWNIELLTGVGKDGAVAHNNIFRGKKLGDRITEKQYEVIKNGTFKDLYIGDYWVINGIKYIIVDFDYLNVNKHHMILMGSKVYNNLYIKDNFGLMPVNQIRFSKTLPARQLSNLLLDNLKKYDEYIIKTLGFIYDTLPFKEYVKFPIDLSPYYFPFCNPINISIKNSDERVSYLSKNSNLGFSIFIPRLSMISDYSYRFNTVVGEKYDTMPINGLYINEFPYLFEKLTYFKYAKFDPYNEDVNRYIVESNLSSIGITTSDSAYRTSPSGSGDECFSEMNYVIQYLWSTYEVGGIRKKQPYPIHLSETTSSSLLPMFIIS